jgi:hypothetical protein
VPKKRKKNSKKEPFWKNLAPEWKHVSEHIGKIVDNMKPNDILDLAAGLTAFYAGFQVGQMNKVDLLGSIGLGGSGIIAYELAKSGNIVAGASGTAYLASLGLLNLFDPAFGSPPEQIVNWVRAAAGQKPISEVPKITVTPSLGWGFG